MANNVTQPSGTAPTTVIPIAMTSAPTNISPSLSGGDIAGIIVGAVVGFALLVVVFVVLVVWSFKHRSRSSSSHRRDSYAIQDDDDADNTEPKKVILKKGSPRSDRLDQSDLNNPENKRSSTEIRYGRRSLRIDSPASTPAGSLRIARQKAEKSEESEEPGAHPSSLLIKPKKKLNYSDSDVGSPPDGDDIITQSEEMVERSGSKSLASGERSFELAKVKDRDLQVSEERSSITDNISTPSSLASKSSSVLRDSVPIGEQQEDGSFSEGNSREEPIVVETVQIEGEDEQIGLEVSDIGSKGSESSVLKQPEPSDPDVEVEDSGSNLYISSEKSSESPERSKQ